MHWCTKICLLMVLSLSLPAWAEPFSMQIEGVEEGANLPPALVYRGYGCQGGNRSPAVHWQGLPPAAKSLALTVFDPDAPGAGWWHWVVLNLPVTASGLAAGAGAAQASLPRGAHMLRNDFGAAAFGGACPPPGDRAHRYVFTLTALDQPLVLTSGATAAMAGEQIRAHSLQSVSVTAYYGR